MGAVKLQHLHRAPADCQEVVRQAIEQHAHVLEGMAFGRSTACGVGRPDRCLAQHADEARAFTLDSKTAGQDIRGQRQHRFGVRGVYEQVVAMKHEPQAVITHTRWRGPDRFEM